jgi:hypothetical protein
MFALSLGARVRGAVRDSAPARGIALPDLSVGNLHILAAAD